MIKTFTYEVSINTETGEILKTKLINSLKDERIVDNSEDPKLYLEDNKYRLNDSAISLFDTNSKLVIRYEQTDNGDIPIIGNSESFGIKEGNKITKSNTVSFRGSKNDELAKYGNEFTLIPHSIRPNIFILKSDKQEDIKQGDENVNIEDTIFNLDFEDIVDNEDINSDFFQL